MERETAAVAAAVRDQINGRWLRAWLFFTLADGVTGGMLYVDRGENQPIEELFPRDVARPLLNLFDRSAKIGSAIKSGVATLDRTGAFDVEFGYADVLEPEDRSEEFNHNMRSKYFPNRSVSPANFDAE